MANRTSGTHGNFRWQESLHGCPESQAGIEALRHLGAGPDCAAASVESHPPSPESTVNVHQALGIGSERPESSTDANTSANSNSASGLHVQGTAAPPQSQPPSVTTSDGRFLWSSQTHPEPRRQVRHFTAVQDARARAVSNPGSSWRLASMAPVAPAQVEAP
jgi:hypothetical protein